MVYREDSAVPIPIPSPVSASSALMVGSKSGKGSSGSASVGLSSENEIGTRCFLGSVICVEVLVDAVDSLRARAFLVSLARNSVPFLVEASMSTSRLGLCGAWSSAYLGGTRCLLRIPQGQSLRAELRI